MQFGFTLDSSDIDIDMSSRRLQYVFNVTIFGLPRRLEGVLGDEKLLRLSDVLKTSRKMS